MQTTMGIRRPGPFVAPHSRPFVAAPVNGPDLPTGVPFIIGEPGGSVFPLAFPFAFESGQHHLPDFIPFVLGVRIIPVYFSGANMSASGNLVAAGSFSITNITDIGTAQAYNGAAGSSVTITKPTGAAAGDYVYVILTTSLAQSLPTVAGWTLLTSTSVPGQSRHGVYRRKLDGTESASPMATFPLGASGNFSLVRTPALRGVHATTPERSIGAWGFQNNAATVPAPGVTAKVNDRLLGFYGQQGANAAISSPMTEFTESAGNFSSSTICSANVTVDGATGVRVFSAAANGAAVLIDLRVVGSS